MSSERTKEGLALIEELQSTLSEIKAKISQSGEAKIVSSGRGSLDQVFQEIVDTAMGEFASLLTHNTNTQISQQLCELEIKLVTLLSEWQQNKDPGRQDLMKLFRDIQSIEDKVAQIEPKLPGEEEKLEIECNESNLLNSLKECITIEEEEVKQNPKQTQNELIFQPKFGEQDIIEFNVISKTQRLLNFKFLCPCNFGICTEGSKSYIAGGRPNPLSHIPSDLTYMIDPTGIVPLTNLNRKRYSLSLALLKKTEIYATGGTVTSSLAIAQKYTLASDKWELIKQMKRPHSDHGSTGFNDNKIYVFLGISNEANTSTVEMYDEIIGEWKEVKLKGQLELFGAINCLAAVQKGSQNKILLWSEHMNEKKAYFEFTVDESGLEFTAIAISSNGSMPKAGTQIPVFWSKNRQAAITFGDDSSNEAWEITNSGMTKFQY